MAMGWGQVQGGAWGGGNNTAYQDDEEQAPPPPQQPPPQGAFGGAYAAPATGAYDAPAPELATTSQRSQAPPPANNGGFGASSGAYGRAQGGIGSFAAPASGGTITEAELRRREAELAAKEKQLKELEAKLAKEGKLVRKNWPICYPITYHNIAEEIPPDGPRRVVREGYMAWWGLCICLLWNWFCTCVMLGQQVDQKVPSWFLAILYMLLGIPLSFWLWYKRLYNGAKDDGVVSFIGFFLWFLLHCGFCIWAAIAIPFSANQWSFAGFATALNALDKCAFCGIIYLVGSGLWSLEAAWSCWVLMDVFLFWRGKGGVQQAKETAAKEAALAAFRSSQSTARV